MSAVRSLLSVCLLLVLTPAASAQQWVSPAAAPPPAAAPATGPGIATQGTAPQGTGDYLSRMDIDRDRKVSLLEYQDWLTYAFDGMDRNRDGLLAPEEQPGGRGKAITRDAHRARVAERFGRQDMDRSGFLDAKELSAPPQGR